MAENVLEMKNLKVVFPSEKGLIRAVEGVDIEIEKGKCVALVGESGCGKSVTSLAAMKLLSSPPAVIRIDRLNLCGEDVLNYSDKKMQSVRGSKAAMIF